MISFSDRANHFAAAAAAMAAFATAAGAAALATCFALQFSAELMCKRTNEFRWQSRRGALGAVSFAKKTRLKLPQPVAAAAARCNVHSINNFATAIESNAIWACRTLHAAAI